MGILLGTLLSCAAAAAPSKPAALVLRVQGGVMVRRGDKQKPAAARMPLQWNDHLAVPRGASALLLFSNGKQVHATKNTDISPALAAMTPAQAQAMKPDSAFYGAPGDLDMYGGVGAGTRAVLGDLGGGQAFVRITAPRNTNLLDDRPVFAWACSQPGAAVIMSLTDENGNEVWATGTLAGYADFPAQGLPLLQDAAYALHITAAVNGRTVRDDAEFYILSEDKAESVRVQAHGIRASFSGPDDAFARHIALTLLFKQHELYADAARELQALLQEEPENVLAYLELSDVHRLTGYELGQAMALLKASVLAEQNGDPFAF